MIRGFRREDRIRVTKSLVVCAGLGEPAIWIAIKMSAPTRLVCS
jgi:hypothetical protein